MYRKQKNLKAKPNSLRRLSEIGFCRVKTVASQTSARPRCSFVFQTTFFLKNMMAGFQTSFLLCFFCFFLCCCEFIIWKQQLSIKTGLNGIQLDPHHRRCVRMEGTGLYKKHQLCFALLRHPLPKKKLIKKTKTENFAFFCLQCSFPLFDVKVQINTE